MTLLLEEEVEIPFSFDYKQVAEDVVKQTLDFEEFPYEVEVSMVLTDDASIHQLNQEFRHMDRATDVLSFPLMLRQEIIRKLMRISAPIPVRSFWEIL